MAVLGGVGASHSSLILGLGKCLSCPLDTSWMGGMNYPCEGCGGWKCMKIWVLKIHVLGEEFMDTMDDAPTCTAPCTGVESPMSVPPPMDYPYPQTAQTCQCGEQGCSPALCQELNTMNVKGELLLHADHGALNPMSCWAHTLCVVQGWEVHGVGPTIPGSTSPTLLGGH